MAEKPRFGWHVAMIVSAAGFKDFRKYTHHELELQGVELRGYEHIRNWLANYKPSDKGLWLTNPLRTMR